MNTISFKAEKRDIQDKAANVRKAGRIPAVIYGGDTLEHISTTHKEVKHLIYTPDFKLAEIDMDGKKIKCIVKDIQFHPLTENIDHIDFLAIEDGRKVKVNIPVRFTGESPGVKLGGKLMQSLRKVQVKLDPKDMVDQLTIDISNLELGDAVRVKDIEVKEGIEIMVNPSIPIAAVEVPRAVKTEEAEEVAAPAEGEAAAPAEGEVAS